MSRRKKPNYKQIKQARADTAWQFDRAMTPQVRENRDEAVQFALDRPELATEIVAMTADDMALMAVQIAYPELVGDPSHEDKLAVAVVIRRWHIYHDYQYFFDWWPAIDAMTTEQIVAQCQDDARTGRLPRPPA